MNVAMLKVCPLMFVRLLSVAHTLSVTGLICLIAASTVWAEDAPFANPDAQPTKTQKKPRELKVFSFARFEPPLREICREMEADGRRTKLVQLSEVERKGNAECASCRALWKSIYWACRDSAILEDKDKAKKKKNKEKPKEPTSDEGGEEGSEAPAAEPTPTPKPLQRYPTTVMLDLTSRLSVSLYEQDPGKGSYYAALQSLATTLSRAPSLTPGERDYYSVFVSFLLASWADREEHEVDDTQVEKPELGAMFE